MPIETLPDLNQPPFIPTTNNITQCIKGGNVQNFGEFVTNGSIIRNFKSLSNTSILGNTYPSISPISFEEELPLFNTSLNNCSLYNRNIQSKILIDSQSLSSIQLGFSSEIHLFYGDTESPAVGDYTPPTLTLNNTNTLNQTLLFNNNDQSPNVYESAYFIEGDIKTNGANILTALAISPIPVSSDNGSYSILFDTEDLGLRWIIKNNNSNHQNWSHYHSNTPLNNPYVTFDEDQWWIYDFGVNNQQILEKIDIFFTFSDAFRHSHIEISGSNSPDIFSTNPSNQDNVTGDHWTGISTLNNTVEEETFPINGTISAEINNNVLYRWYKLTFKSDGFEGNELHINNLNFFKKEISNVNEVKMSDFYGLFLIESSPQEPFLPWLPPPEPLYNAGYKIINNLDESFPEIKLGGNPL